MELTKNLLYYGDNLDILRQHIADETVDLVYLDPPFNSNRNYNILFAEKNGSRSAAQVQAFQDTWRWGSVAEEAYTEMVQSGEKISDVLQGLRKFLNESNMMAYLAMMTPRLIELRRVLKPTGSIYLHCNPTASHYLKMVMDAVFGAKNFRNEIVWSYQRWTGVTDKFQRMHDVILSYAKKESNVIFNTQYEPYSQKSQHKAKRISIAVKGKVVSQTYTEDTSRQKAMRDVWEISYLNSQAKGRLGYPTQKPEALLERIIKASSNKGDVVLDPFCGCGTTVAVAQRLNRRWIGIDITHLSVALMKHRLYDAFGKEIRQTYEVIGEPKDLAGATQLANDDPYQFQCWALGLVDARPVGGVKKGSDKGIDGRLLFHDEGDSKKTKQIILSVKAGHTGVSHIRDLRGVMDREKAEIGVLITMQEPTQPMRTEAASAGFYFSPGWNKNYPKLQILSISDLFAGKSIDMPPKTNITFKKASPVKGEKPQTALLPLEQNCGK